jgi:hypothetical protein
MYAYLLAALVLMSVLSAALSGPDIDPSGYSADTITAGVRAQADLIRTKITSCALRFPLGGWPAAPSTGLVRDLDCPGYHPVLATSTARNIWIGEYRPTFLPVPPSGLGEWNYLVTAQGISIAIQPATAAMAADTGIQLGLLNAQRRFAASEAALNSGTQQLTIVVRSP